MRLKIASLRRGVKGDLRVEFVRQDLTSYGGLELYGTHLLCELKVLTHGRLRLTGGMAIWKKSPSLGNCSSSEFLGGPLVIGNCSALRG